MAQLNIRVDDADKRDFDEFCKGVGMTSSTAINIYIKTVLNQNRIPFEITPDPFYSASNQAVLKEAIEQLEAGKGREK